DRRKLSHRGGGKRRYLSHILGPFALRTSGDLFVCAKDLLVESIGTWATQASSGFHRCTYPHAGHRRGRATGGKVSKMTISVIRPVGTGRFVCGHLITTSLTANPSTGIRRRSEPKILMRRRGAAAKGLVLASVRTEEHDIKYARRIQRLDLGRWEMMARTASGLVTVHDNPASFTCSQCGADAQRARRVHPRMSGDPCRPQAQGDRCN